MSGWCESTDKMMKMYDSIGWSSSSLQSGNKMEEYHQCKNDSMNRKQMRRVRFIRSWQVNNFILLRKNDIVMRRQNIGYDILSRTNWGRSKCTKVYQSNKVMKNVVVVVNIGKEERRIRKCVMHINKQDMKIKKWENI